MSKGETAVVVSGAAYKFFKSALNKSATPKLPFAEVFTCLLPLPPAASIPTTASFLSSPATNRYSSEIKSCIDLSDDFAVIVTGLNNGVMLSTTPDESITAPVVNSTICVILPEPK